MAGGQTQWPHGRPRHGAGWGRIRVNECRAKQSQRPLPSPTNCTLGMCIWQRLRPDGLVRLRLRMLRRQLPKACSSSAKKQPN
jgi:hypothetical protein